jgi:hypothetical protein
MSNKTFSFEYEGTKYEIPSISELPNGILRKTRKIEDELDKSYTILEELLGIDSKELKALDKMTVEQFSEVIQKWTSGASLGESSGSES